MRLSISAFAPASLPADFLPAFSPVSLKTAGSVPLRICKNKKGPCFGPVVLSWCYSSRVRRFSFRIYSSVRRIAQLKGPGSLNFLLICKYKPCLPISEVSPGIVKRKGG